MAVIAISRWFGAGGKILGMMIAEKLNDRSLDDQNIQAITNLAKKMTMIRIIIIW